MSDPQPPTDPPADPPAPPNLPSSATKDPDTLKELYDLLVKIESQNTEISKSQATEIAALKEELGLTRKQLSDFWDWAKTDPNEGGSVAAPGNGAPSTVPTAPTPTPADGGAAPSSSAPQSATPAPPSAPTEPEKKRSFLDRVW